MPPLKQPASLISSTARAGVKSMQRAINQIAKRSNDSTGNNEDWEALLSEIRHMANLISVFSLPTSLLQEISNNTISIFNELFDENEESSFVNSTTKERVDQIGDLLMKFIFNDALKTLDVTEFKAVYGKHYVISNFASVPKIKILRISGTTFLINSKLFKEKLENNIHYLCNLTVLELPVKCSDVIIKEISNHCPNVETLIVKLSREVTDQSVPYLQKMKKLINLNVMSTGMSTEGYRTVLESLPFIAVIYWDKVFIAQLLSGMTPEILKNKVKVNCKLDLPRVLVDKCPNVKELTFEESQTVNLYPLTELKELKYLSIKVDKFPFVQLNSIFECTGENLDSLKFQYVRLFRIDLIIRYCVSLRKLVIKSSTIFKVDNRDLFPEMPHFINLKYLTLEKNTLSSSFCQIVKNYVNLKSLTLLNRRSSHGYFNHRYFENVIQMGGYRDLEEFNFEGYLDLTMRTALRLIENCPKLRILSALATWRGVSQNDITTLKEEIVRNNYDLKVS